MLQVEYIESTGTQYIDTGFKPNNNTRLTMECQLTSITSSWAFLFGARDTYHSNEFSFAWNTSNWYTGFNTADNRITSPARNTTTMYSIDKNKNVTNINSTSTTNTNGTFTCSYNLLLFGLKNGSDIYYGNAKIYSCKIYDNDTLVRNFIPVLDDNGVACLYDQVGSQLYYNQGTGLFAHPQPTDMTLIFDRTNNDVKLGRLKGQYNAFDLNRVEHWCRYLADELNAVGYNIQITTKETWAQTDMRTSAEMERIRKNIQKIMEGYHWITKIYANAESFNYVKANNWEKILYEIYSLMYGMQNMYVYGGVARGGEPLLWQNNFMHLYNG